MFLWTMVLPLTVIENTRPIVSVEVTLSGQSARVQMAKPVVWVPCGCAALPMMARRHSSRGTRGCLTASRRLVWHAYCDAATGHRSA